MGMKTGSLRSGIFLMMLVGAFVAGRFSGGKNTAGDGVVDGDRGSAKRKNQQGHRSLSNNSSGGSIKQQLGAAFAPRGRYERVSRFLNVLDSADANNWRDILDGFERWQEGSGINYRETIEYRAFLLKLAEVAPSEAAQLFLERNEHPAARVVLKEFANMDPGRAKDWMNNNPQANTWLRTPVMQGLAESNVAAFEELLSSNEALKKAAPWELQQIGQHLATYYPPEASSGIISSVLSSSGTIDAYKPEVLTAFVQGYEDQLFNRIRSKDEINLYAQWLSQYAQTGFLDNKMVARGFAKIADNAPLDEATTWLDNMQRSAADYRKILEGASLDRLVNMSNLSVGVNEVLRNEIEVAIQKRSPNKGEGK
jgi:hypothetical protein